MSPELPVYRCTTHTDRVFDSRDSAREHVKNNRPTDEPSTCAVTGVAECDRCETYLYPRHPGRSKNGVNHADPVVLRHGGVYCSRGCALMDTDPHGGGV